MDVEPIKRFRQHVISLMVGAALIAVASLLWRVWISHATTGEQCRTGSGGSAFGIVIFVGLVLLGPVGFGVCARRAGLPSAWTLGVAVVATFVAAFAVYLTGQFWWSAHDCMT